MKRSKSILVLVTVGFALGWSTTSARGELIQLHFTGLNFTYSGGQIYDSTSPFGRELGSVSNADSLADVSVFKDSVLQSPTYGDGQVFADLLVGNVSHIPMSGGTVNALIDPAGFGVDLLYANGQPMLQLNITSFQVTYFGGGFFIAAGGTASSIYTQALPNGMRMSESAPVQILISSSNLRNVQTDGTYLTHFDAFGTGDINGTLVPEPASLAALASLVGVALACALLRRKRRS